MPPTASSRRRRRAAKRAAESRSEPKGSFIGAPRCLCALLRQVRPWKSCLSHLSHHAGIKRPDEANPLACRVVTGAGRGCDPSPCGRRDRSRRACPAARRCGKSVLVMDLFRQLFEAGSLAGPWPGHGAPGGGLAGDRGWSSYADRRADRAREDPGGVPGLRRPHLPAAQGERPRPERAAGPQVVYVPLFKALGVDSRTTCRRGWARSRSTRGRMILRPPYRLGKVASDPLSNARDARMNRRPLDPQDCGLGVDAGQASSRRGSGRCTDMRLVRRGAPRVVPKWSPTPRPR